MKTIITIPSQCVIADNFRWLWYRWPIYLYESYHLPNIKHPHRPVPSFCGSITSTIVTDGVEYFWRFYHSMKIPMISPLVSHLMGVYLINSPLSPMKSPRKSPVRWWQLLTVEARTFFKQIVRAVPGAEKSWVFFVSEHGFKGVNHQPIPTNMILVSENGSIPIELPFKRDNQSTIKCSKPAITSWCQDVPSISIIEMGRRGMKFSQPAAVL